MLKFKKKKKTMFSTLVRPLFTQPIFERDVFVIHSLQSLKLYYFHYQVKESLSYVPPLFYSGTQQNYLLKKKIYQPNPLFTEGCSMNQCNRKHIHIFFKEMLLKISIIIFISLIIKIYLSPIRTMGFNVSYTLESPERFKNF